MNSDEDTSTTSEESRNMEQQNPNKYSDTTPASPAEQTCSCQTQANDQAAPQQFIYSLGKLDIRFPSIGIEREFQQRERHLSPEKQEQLINRGERLSTVLLSTPHLSRSVCFVHSIGGIPAYSIVPTSSEILNHLIDALRHVDDHEAWILTIGRAGPMAKPNTCGGLLIQMLGCDAFYCFTLSDFVRELSSKVEPALKREKIKEDLFSSIAKELFLRIASSLENMGGLDQHRALNYMLVQHPAPFVEVAKRAGTAVLDCIETRINITPGTRRIVTIIFTFIDKVTGVPERLFTRIDVTEEWPFVADALNAGSPPLGLSPFVDGGGTGSYI
jgi:hypothetical protein